MNKQQEVILEARKRFHARFKFAHEMLNSPGGKQLMENLEVEAFNPLGKEIFQPDSDQTAFNLGIMFVYSTFKKIQKGMTEEDNGN